MPRLNNKLILDRCPHCSIAHPNLAKVHNLETKDHSGHIHRFWYVYKCDGCGGIVTAWALNHGQEVIEIFPQHEQVDEEIPEKPKAFLEQAIASIHAPAGAVMLAASSVDSMLKLKNYIQGSLCNRIESAARDHLITSEMAEWAHEVRLDANDQRHADEKADLPTCEDAKRAIDFTRALAEFMFVLPEKVRKGREKANK